MTILKGRDFEMVIVLTNCHTDIDISGITDFVCYFYTKEGGAAIERTKDQFAWDETGTIGTTILTGTELNGLEDGVLRYQYDADGQVVKRTTNYYLKTPVDFSGQTYTTEEDVESIVDSMTEDFITEAELEEAVADAVSAISATTVEEVEEMIADAISGISGGSIESYVFTPEVGAQIWAKYSGLTVDELNARVRVLSPAGYEMVCVSKTTNPDQFNFRGSGINNNGSYWVLSEAEAWARETGSFGRDWWNAAPQHMYIYTTDRTISKSRSGSRLPVPLGWHTIVRGLKNGASFTGVVDASDDNDLAGMNSANVHVIVNSTIDNEFAGNITIIADFYSATDSAFVKASWTVDYNNNGMENITLNYWNILS